MKKTPATEKEIYLSFTLLSHTQFYLHKSDYFVQNLTLFYYGFIYKVPVRGLKKMFGHIFLRRVNLCFKVLCDHIHRMPRSQDALHTSIRCSGNSGNHTINMTWSEADFLDETEKQMWIWWKDFIYSWFV